jgi:hypothetical protein
MALEHPVLQNVVNLKMRNTHFAPIIVLQALHHMNATFNQISFSSNDCVEAGTKLISGTYPITVETGELEKRK